MGWGDAPIVSGSPAGATATSEAKPAWMNAPVVSQSTPSESPLKKYGEYLESGPDAAASLLSGAVATPIAGLAGLGAAATKAVGATEEDPADVVRGVESALTLKPRTPVGKDIVKGVSYPFEELAKGANAVGAKTAAATGSPALGAAVNVGIQSIPAIVGKGAGMLREGAEASDAAAENLARDYVSRHTDLDWGALSDRFKATLTKIAHDVTNLSKLDPKAVERQARLERLGLPATRGQVTRDLGQLTREEAIAKSDAGAGIRDINAEQDRILHQHLDTLRGETGGTAETRGQVGKSVQEAARGKLNTLRGQYQAAYAKAKEEGAGLEPADITPLREWLKNPTNARNAGYLKSAIADYVEKGADGKPLENGRVTINDLEEIRKEATANAKKPGPEGHFAKEATGVIDQILDDSGSAVYKDARAKFKAVKDEFDRQGRVAALVKQKGMSRDRAVALEDTFDSTVLKGSNEQLQAVRDTLTKGGTKETQAKGAQAWNDLRAAAIDYLKEKAAGKRAIPGEKSQLQFNSPFIEAVNELDKDGKLDTLFGPGTTERLRELMRATQDVRTKPTGRIAGSDTAPRVINFLEKLAQVPGAGKFLAGTVGALRKVTDIGAEAREAGRAKTTPMEEAAARTRRNANTLEALQRSGGAGAGYTLQGEGDQ